MTWQQFHGVSTSVRLLERDLDRRQQTLRSAKYGVKIGLERQEERRQERVCKEVGAHRNREQRLKGMMPLLCCLAHSDDKKDDDPHGRQLWCWPCTGSTGILTYRLQCHHNPKRMQDAKLNRGEC